MLWRDTDWNRLPLLHYKLYLTSSVILASVAVITVFAYALCTGGSDLYPTFFISLSRIGRHTLLALHKDGEKASRPQSRTPVCLTFVETSRLHGDELAVTTGKSSGQSLIPTSLPALVLETCWHAIVAGDSGKVHSCYPVYQSAFFPGRSSRTIWKKLGR